MAMVNSTRESSAFASHRCLERHACTTCIFKSLAIGSCERFFCSRSMRLRNSSRRTLWPMSIHCRGNSLSAHCCNLTSTVVLNPLESKVDWRSRGSTLTTYPSDSAWAALTKTSLKMKLDMADHNCLDKLSSLGRTTVCVCESEHSSMAFYHCRLGIWLRLTTSSRISPRAFSNNSSWTTAEECLIIGCAKKWTNSILFPQFGKTILPFSFQIEPRGFECVWLLFDTFFDHFPKAIADSETQITRRRLRRFEDSIPTTRDEHHDEGISQKHRPYRKSFERRKKSSSYFWIDSIESSALPRRLKLLCWFEECLLTFASDHSEVT